MRSLVRSAEALERAGVPLQISNFKFQKDLLSVFC